MGLNTRLRRVVERLASRRRTARELIVNADDFGMSEAVNSGIIQAHEHGIVTSASLMVCRAGALEAGRYARAHPALSTGLHVDLGEWICRDREWQPAYVVAALDDARAIAASVSRQLEAFGDLVGRAPTHVDSHQHVHREEPTRGALLELATALDVPLRHFDGAVQYCGRFYGQEKYGERNDGAIGVEALIELVAALPRGLTELCCHPGDQSDADEQYARARPLETATLCDPRVRAALAREGIALRSFHRLRRTPR